MARSWTSGCGAAPYRPAFTARYIGVDITDEPYREGVPRKVDIVAAAHAIPLDSGSADLLFTVGALFLMRDPRLVLNEFRRILRPDGRLLIFDYNRRTLREMERKTGDSYPIWTQWGLARKVRGAGYREVRLLVARADRPPRRRRLLKERLTRLAWAELAGRWGSSSPPRLGDAGGDEPLREIRRLPVPGKRDGVVGEPHVVERIARLGEQPHHPGARATAAGEQLGG